MRRHIREKRRQARAAARKQAQAPESKGRTYRKWSIIAGLTVVSGILLFEGGKLVLKLLAEKKNKPG